ncbi:MAG: hypothetical protein ACOVT5_09605 [Armatimonadaceae bacterium]|jgi:hypothetical protein
MKQSIPVPIIAAILVVLVAIVGFVYWKKDGGGQTGRAKSNLGQMETDPNKFKSEMDRLMKESPGKK